MEKPMSHSNISSITRRDPSRLHITGRVLTLTEENRAAYNIRLEALIDDLQPQGALELALVQSIARAFWRLSRAEAIRENNVTLPALALPALYEQRIRRRLRKDLKILRDRQANRPVSQATAPPGAQPTPQLD